MRIVTFRHDGKVQHGDRNGDSVTVYPDATSAAELACNSAGLAPGGQLGRPQFKSRLEKEKFVPEVCIRQLQCGAIKSVGTAKALAMPGVSLLPKWNAKPAP